MSTARILLTPVVAALALPLCSQIGRLVIGSSRFSLMDLAWESATVLVMGCALVYPVGRSRWHGWRLLGALFILVGGVNALLVPFEMLVFTESAGVAPLVVMWLLRAAALSAILVIGLERWRRPTSSQGSARVPEFSFLGWLWRILAGVSTYTVLFMIAGLLIMRLDAVPDYTAPSPLPEAAAESPDQGTAPARVDDNPIRVPPPGVIFTFIFTRGLACIAFSLLLLRGLQGGRWTAGLAAGIALAVLGGVAPLLAPNPTMTTGARMAHMLEIGWSNLAYGLLIGYLFGNRRAVDD